MSLSTPTTTALFYLALIFSLAVNNALAQTAGRSNTCCGLMSGKVYCFGGVSFTGATENADDTVVNVLDITNQSGTSSSDLQNKWESVTYVSDNVNLTDRSDFQCIVTSDQNRMLVNGGYSLASVRTNNTNVMYDTLQNEWYAQPDYIESPYGIRQIYWASASYVPGKGAAFYGGYERFINPNWTTPNVNASIFTFANGLSRLIGYTQVSYFNVDAPVPTWSTPVPLTVASDQFHARHQSVFDPITNMLLFMGGVYRTPRSDQPIPSLYSNIRTFNTLTNEWGTMNLTGNDIPTPNRFFSTLTLLPSTNRHVLLYGGEVDDRPVKDYCNVLNLDTKVWTKQTIDAPAGTTLQRSRHSSVLVNNNTLFIMWGIDNNLVGKSSVLILNTTDPNAITMSDKYIDPNAPNAAEDSNNNTIKPGDGTTGLSTGIKAGIAVAAVVVAILSALVIWFYLRNKKKNERIRDQERELAKQQQQQQQADYYHDTDAEPLEVDWDQIEKKYTEMPVNTSTNNNTEQFSSIRGSAASTTVVNGGEANSTAYAARRPNTMDLPPQPFRVMKPDSGYY